MCSSCDIYVGKLRTTGLEPATNRLKVEHSTIELYSYDLLELSSKDTITWVRKIRTLNLRYQKALGCQLPYNPFALY